ncbi:MAG: energy-coupling factor transporter transmembrane component T family protein [Lachnospiraceae bacterium]
MLRDITIGKYYPSNSIIHRLDPRTKIIAVFLYAIGLFATQSIPFLLFNGVLLFFLIVCSHIPPSYIVRGLKPILILLVFSAGINLFFTKGEVLWAWHGLSITREGLHTACVIVIRLIFLMIGTAFFTLTTTPTRMTDGLEKLFGCLNQCKIPVHEIAMMMSIALRFIPILVEELDKIMKAQSARGADFEEGNLLHRMKSLVPVLVPLFVSSISRANDLAMAMEARCYHGGDGRTKMKPLAYQRADYRAFALMGLYAVGVALVVCL